VNDDRVSDLLVHALQDNEYFTVRARAAETLGVLKSRRAVGALTRAATYDLDNDVRAQSATAVYRILGKDALPLLELVLRDEDEFTRDHIATLLGEIDDPHSIRLLRALLKDPDGLVVSTAKESLKQLAVDEVPR
jgi:HEAT repeat protein